MKQLITKPKVKRKIEKNKRRTKEKKKKEEEEEEKKYNLLRQPECTVEEKGVLIR